MNSFQVNQPFGTLHNNAVDFRVEQSTKLAADLEGSNLVDSASSHMLVSRTKPCMPQNNCIAGICAWLITSDVICRNSFAVSALLDNLAKCQANT